MQPDVCHDSDHSGQYKDEAVKYKAAVAVWILLFQGVLAGCATQSAPEFRGKWRPVNRFDDVAEEIPLSPTYIFFASPTDRTLKAMLTRWASDSGVALAYQLGSDYTLHAPVSKVRTADLQEALAQLTGVYADKGISLAVVGSTIVVQPAGKATSDSSAGSDSLNSGQQ